MTVTSTHFTLARARSLAAAHEHKLALALAGNVDGLAAIIGGTRPRTEAREMIKRARRYTGPSTVAVRPDANGRRALTGPVYTGSAWRCDAWFAPRGARAFGGEPGFAALILIEGGTRPETARRIVAVTANANPATANYPSRRKWRPTAFQSF